MAQQCHSRYKAKELKTQASTNLKVHGSMSIQLNITNNHDCHPLMMGWIKRGANTQWSNQWGEKCPCWACPVQAKDAPITNSLSSHHETTSKQSPAKKQRDRQSHLVLSHSLHSYIPLKRISNTHLVGTALWFLFCFSKIVAFQSEILLWRWAAHTVWPSHGVQQVTQIQPFFYVQY